MGIIKLNDKDFSGISMDIATNLDENSTDTQVASAKAVYDELTKVGSLSNPNLLDNPDFSVNQRGQTKYNGAVYTVDRWTLGKDTTLLNVVDNGIKLGYVADSSPTDPAICIQRIENPTRFAGKTVTATVCVEETTSVQAQMLVRCTTEDGTTTYINKTFSTIGIHSVTGVIPNAKITKLELWLYGADIRVDGDAVDNYTIFNWVKLELGSVATPYIAPHPATELAKCQRYYQTTPFHAPVLSCSVNALYFLVNLPTTMQTSPSLVGDISWKLYDTTVNTVSAENTDSSWSLSLESINSKSTAILKLIKASHGITGNCYLYVSGGGLSADL